MTETLHPPEADDEIAGLSDGELVPFGAESDYLTPAPLKDKAPTWTEIPSGTDKSDLEMDMD